MKNFNPIRGCDDYLPREAMFRNDVKQAIVNSYLKNGFNLISTPVGKFGTFKFKRWRGQSSPNV